MDVSLRYNRQMRSLSIAMATAIVASVGAMFIPAAAYEAATGATGISEMIPAAAAPLGDTARALIAFGAGAMTLAVMTLVLLGADKGPSPRVAEDIAADDEDARPNLIERLANMKLPAIGTPKWPWLKDDDDITEFADLPKLRGNDIHPDAPPRRPLSATSDLPVLDLVGMEVHASTARNPASAVVVEPVATMAFEPPSAAVQPSSDTQPMIADMVAQLEAAVAQRQQQLNELEAVAAKLAGSKPMQPTADEDELDIEILPEVIRSPRPPLEAVPSVPAPQDDMDDALAAALATLHRMNGTDR